MLKQLFFLFFTIFFILSLSGCKKANDPLNQRYQVSATSLFNSTEYEDLDKVIDEIANQLLLNISSNNHKNYKIAITTLVQLDDFEKTSSFGRTVSESLINELHARRFKVIDLRTREVITVNEEGEFVLTRDVNELKDEIPNAYTLLGTYSILDDNRIVINTRIMDIFSSDVISTSRVLYRYKECEKYDLCSKNIQKRTPKKLNILEEK